MALDISRMNSTVLRRLIEAGHSTTEIAAMSAEEALDIWLRYEGIIGWTQSIVDMLDGLRKSEDKP